MIALFIDNGIENAALIPPFPEKELPSHPATTSCATQDDERKTALSKAALKSLPDDIFRCTVMVPHKH